jgi:hypothetical protein
MSLSSVGVHPAYDALRGEPRFEALLHRLRLSGPRLGTSVLRRNHGP